jgi:C4-dicarboxylate-specific signal transduction histidine kinase
MALRKQAELNPTRHSALRLVLALAVSIFVAEAAVMTALALLPPLGTWTTTFLDATSMVLLSSPLLYWFAFRPLVRMLQAREAATRALHEANAHLEARVLERTASLEQTNQKLSAEIVARQGRVGAHVRCCAGPDLHH